jgi:hypothetical protein
LTTAIPSARPPDPAGAIRAAPDISATAKRHLVGIVNELRSMS